MGEVNESYFPENRNLVTHYIKKYPDRYKVIQYKSPYPDPAVPRDSENKLSASSWLQSAEDAAESLEDSVTRSKTRISDLTICNAFDMFVTFTFNCRACIPKCANNPCRCDKENCKRYDLDYVIRTQKTWYNNQIKQYGRFPYLQVMELHKDKGYHFHALFKDYTGPLKYWKRDKKDGRPIYNLQSNRKGWTTVKRIYDISGTSSYIKKYITKDMQTIPSKKRYWASQGLKRVIVIQDTELMRQILANPAAKTYIPDAGEREDQRKSSNVASITTLMIDNQASYLKDLEALKRIESQAKATRRLYGET